MANKKPAKKEQAEAPMLFAEPGSNASVPQESHEVAPDPEQEVADAEAILDPEDLPRAVEDERSYEIDDLLAEMVKDAEEGKLQSMLTEVLDAMDALLPRLSVVARKNGYPGLASDFNSLMMAGRHVAKKAAKTKYLVSK